jgi:hypothetical protein
MSFLSPAVSCFSHIIGLPQKDGHDMPLLPYQRTLHDSLQNYKHVWIKKSRGLGVTEFLLRYIAYCCTSGKFASNSRVCIVVGPRINSAEDLIARFKALFGNSQKERTQSTVAVNGVSGSISLSSRRHNERTNQFQVHSVR